MATRTLGPTYGWAVGETISVYERNSLNQQTGAAITTAAVGVDSTVTFAGLDDDLKLIATDGTNAVRFGTLTDPTTGGGGGTGDVTEEMLDDAIAAHAADTTSVHGIANTASLATSSDVSGAVAAHSADTTGVHGISDTDRLVASNVFNGTVFQARTDQDMELWTGGDASEDDPSADMATGDVWYPESE